MKEELFLSNLEKIDNQKEKEKIVLEEEGDIVVSEKNNPSYQSERALETQSKLITTKENENSPKERKTLSRIRKAVGSLMIAGLSLLPLGCSEEGNPELETEKEKIESVEEKNEEINNKNLLRDVFFSMSNNGNSMGESREGNLIIDIGGGNFYELTNNNLQELMDLVGRYNTPSLSKRKNIIQIKVVDKIQEIGSKIDYINLPEELRIKETERRDALNQIQDGSIIQPY